MGFLSGLFGTTSGAGFKAQAAPVMQTLTPEQLAAAQAQQAAFTTSVAGAAPGAIQAQQALQQQLLNQTQGLGPNVAKAQLAQATGANVANQAALMAGQRGAGANAGLLARQAAQQGAQTQQQAVGQAATLGVQQQLAAQQQLGNLAAQQVGQAGQATQAQQQQLLNAAAQLNQANIANIQQQNQYNAQIAAGNQQFQSGLANGVLSAAGQGISLPFMGAKGGQVQSMADGGMPDEKESDSSNWFSKFRDTLSKESTAPNYQSGFAAGQSVGQGVGKMFGRLFGGAGTPQLPTAPQTGQLGVNMAMPQMANPLPTSQNIAAMPMPTIPSAPVQPAPGFGVSTAMPTITQPYARGGKVDAMLSPGERYLSPDQVQSVKQGRMNPMDGKLVPGKAKVKGDSLKNDIVPAKLEDGGIVIPRRVTQSENPDDKAMRFVAAVMARQKLKRK
jgi:hypothetical protein